MKTILREFARALLAAVFVMAGSAGVVIASGGGGSGNASITGTLAQFASTTSAQFLGVISNETGSGAVVAASGPTLNNVLVTGGGTTPAIAGTGGTGHGVAFISGTSLGSAGVYGQGVNTAAQTYGGRFIGGSGGGGGAGIYVTAGGSAGWGAVIEGTGSGYGVHATGVNGEALYLVCDSTSPAKACMFMTPQDAQPSAAAVVGNMYLTSAGRLRIIQTAGTPGTAVGQLQDDFGAITAGGTQTQAGATACNTSFCKVTTSVANDGVTLRAGTEPGCQMISNISANALRVYGHNSDNDTIDGGSADVHVTQAASAKSVWYCTTNGVAWTSFQ